MYADLDDIYAILGPKEKASWVTLSNSAPLSGQFRRGKKHQEILRTYGGRHLAADDGQKLAEITAGKIVFDQGLTSAINLILYTFSQTNTVADKNTILAPRRPASQMTKKGWRMFAPDKPTFHLLGGEMGRQLREAAKAATPQASARAAVRTLSAYPARPLAPFLERTAQKRTGPQMAAAHTCGPWRG